MSQNIYNFSEADFNKKFEEDKELTKQLSKERERERLERLNIEKNQKTIAELSVVEILIGIKDTWFELIDDLLQGKFNTATFTKNNRLFYMGITIVLVVLVLYIYYFFSTEQINDNKNNKVIKIYHVYPNKYNSNIGFHTEDFDHL